MQTDRRRWIVWTPLAVLMVLASVALIGYWAIPVVAVALISAGSVQLVKDIRGGGHG